MPPVPFLTADVAVPPDVVGQLSAVFQQKPDLAAVFGSYDDPPFETNFLSQYRNLFHHWDIYRFFKTKRGLFFALMTIPWHWFYYLYSGLAFAVGYAGFKLKKTREAAHHALIRKRYPNND